MHICVFLFFLRSETRFEMAVCTSSSAFLAFWIMALAASALVMARPLSVIFMASSNMDIPSFFGHGTPFVRHLHGLIQHGHSFFLWSWHALCLSSSWPHPTWTFLLSLVMARPLSVIFMASSNMDIRSFFGHGTPFVCHLHGLIQHGHSFFLWSWHALCPSSSWPHPTWTFVLSLVMARPLSVIFMASSNMDIPSFFGHGTPFVCHLHGLIQHGHSFFLWSWHALCLSSSWPHPTWTFLLSLVMARPLSVIFMASSNMDIRSFFGHGTPFVCHLHGLIQHGHSFFLWSWHALCPSSSWPHPTWTFVLSLVMARPLSVIFMASSNMDIPSFFGHGTPFVCHLHGLIQHGHSFFLWSWHALCLSSSWPHPTWTFLLSLVMARPLSVIFMASSNMDIRSFFGHGTPFVCHLHGLIQHGHSFFLWSWHALCPSSSWPHPTWTFVLSLVMARPLSVIFMASSNMDIPSFFGHGTPFVCHLHGLIQHGHSFFLWSWHALCLSSSWPHPTWTFLLSLVMARPLSVIFMASSNMDIRSFFGHGTPFVCHLHGLIQHGHSFFLWSWHALCLSSSWPHPTWTFVLSLVMARPLSVIFMASSNMDIPSFFGHGTPFVRHLHGLIQHGHSFFLWSWHALCLSSSWPHPTWTFLLSLVMACSLSVIFMASSNMDIRSFFGHGTPFVCHFHGLIQHGHSFFLWSWHALCLSSSWPHPTWTFVLSLVMARPLSVIFMASSNMDIRSFFGHGTPFVCHLHGLIQHGHSFFLWSWHALCLSSSWPLPTWTFVLSLVMACSLSVIFMASSNMDIRSFFGHGTPFVCHLHGFIQHGHSFFLWSWHVLCLSSSWPLPTWTFVLSLVTARPLSVIFMASSNMDIRSFFGHGTPFVCHLHGLIQHGHSFFLWSWHALCLSSSWPLPTWTFVFSLVMACSLSVIFMASSNMDIRSFFGHGTPFVCHLHGLIQHGHSFFLWSWHALCLSSSWPLPTWTFVLSLVMACSLSVIFMASSNMDIRSFFGHGTPFVCHLHGLIQHGHSFFLWSWHALCLSSSWPLPTWTFVLSLVMARPLSVIFMASSNMDIRSFFGHGTPFVCHLHGLIQHGHSFFLWSWHALCPSSSWPHPTWTFLLSLVMARPLSVIFMASSNMDIPSFFGHGMPFVCHLHGLIQHGHSFFLWSWHALCLSSSWPHPTWTFVLSLVMARPLSFIFMASSNMDTLSFFGHGTPFVCHLHGLIQHGHSFFLWSWHALCLSSSWPHPTWTFLLSLVMACSLSVIFMASSNMDIRSFFGHGTPFVCHLHGLIQHGHSFFLWSWHALCLSSSWPHPTWTFLLSLVMACSLSVIFMASSNMDIPYFFGHGTPFVCHLHGLFQHGHSFFLWSWHALCLSSSWPHPTWTFVLSLVVARPLSVIFMALSNMDIPSFFGHGMLFVRHLHGLIQHGHSFFLWSWHALCLSSSWPHPTWTFLLSLVMARPLSVIFMASSNMDIPSFFGHGTPFVCHLHGLIQHGHSFFLWSWHALCLSSSWPLPTWTFVLSLVMARPLSVIFMASSNMDIRSFFGRGTPFVCHLHGLIQHGHSFFLWSWHALCPSSSWPHPTWTFVLSLVMARPLSVIFMASSNMDIRSFFGHGTPFVCHLHGLIQHGHSFFLWSWHALCPSSSWPHPTWTFVLSLVMARPLSVIFMASSNMDIRSFFGHGTPFVCHLHGLIQHGHSFFLWSWHALCLSSSWPHPTWTLVLSLVMARPLSVIFMASSNMDIRSFFGHGTPFVCHLHGLIQHGHSFFLWSWHALCLSSSWPHPTWTFVLSLVMARPLSFIFMASSNMDIRSFFGHGSPFVCHLHGLIQHGHSFFLWSWHALCLSSSWPHPTRTFLLSLVMACPLSIIFMASSNMDIPSLFGHGTPFVFHLHGLIQHGHSFFLWSWHALCLSSSWPLPTWTFLLSAKPLSFLPS